MTSVADTIVLLLMLTFPVVLGASPALLPSRIRLSVRWGLVLLLLAVSLWFNYVMSAAPHPFHLAYIVPFWLGLAVAVLMLLFKAAPQERGQ